MNEASMLTPQYAQYTGEPVKVEPVLSVSGLCIEYPNERTKIRNIGFSIARGETFGLIGESGSGKSSVCKAILGLLKDRAQQSGSIRLCGKELLRLSPKEQQKINGKDIGYVMQNPHAAFDPCMKIKRHFMETIKAHRHCSTREAFRLGYELLCAVGLSDAERVMESYPGQLSGGMLQRVMVAIAVSLRPVLLIADEPTGALDAGNCGIVLQLLAKAVKETQAALLFVSHDMNAVANIAERIAVMKEGEIVETGTAETVLKNPRHPYTAELLSASQFAIEEKRCLK